MPFPAKHWIIALFLVFVGPSGHAQWPVQVGDIFVANYGGNSVLKIDPNTMVQTRLATFATPTDLTISPMGELFVAEWGGKIKRLDLKTGTLTVVNPTRSIPQAWGIALSAAGDLYATSRSSNAVYRVSIATGEPTLVSRSNLIQGPIGLDILDEGHLVVASHMNDELVSVDMANGTQTSLDGGQQVNEPWAVATRGADVFVTGYDSKLIQRLRDGNLVELARAPGFPYGLDVAPDGSLVCASTGLADSIDRYDAQGNHLATFSGGMLKQVAGIAVSRFALCGLSIACPTDITARTCDPAGLVVEYPAPTVTGGCPPFTVDSTPSSGSTFPPGTNWVECAATDSAGNRATCSFRVAVTLDATPPSLTCPADVTIECGAATTPDITGTATATDAHDPNPTVTYTDTTTPGTCAGAKAIVRVWRAVDACGNSTTCTQTIGFREPTPAPVILGIQLAPDGELVVAFSGDPQGIAEFVFEEADSLSSVAIWQPMTPQPTIAEVEIGLFEARLAVNPQQPAGFYRILSPGQP